jgi:single-strand DNA-binding protein
MPLVTSAENVQRKVVTTMLNHVSIQGRFARDPELRRTNSGKAVCSFVLACDKPGKDSGASFIDCVAWDKTAEFVSNYFLKGSAIIVEGRLESRQYETKEGQKRTVQEVVVSQAHFCERKQEKSESAGFASPKADFQKEFPVLDDPDSFLPF